MIRAMWRRRVTLLISLLAFATPAAARPLRGGSMATLTMSLRQLPPHAEEWEAFLSLDGGAHYTVRITPHLDLAVRRVSWVVPNVDTAAARIMIRAGNERLETSFQLPEIFVIARDPNAALPPMLAAPLTRAEDGVVEWAEGDRAGTRIALARNAPPPSDMESLHAASAFAEAPLDGPKLRVAHWEAPEANAPRTSPRGHETSQPRNPNNILLLSTRMNV